jgi:hypothetical protein
MLEPKVFMLESKVVLETAIPVIISYQNKEQGFQSCYNESSILADT